MDHLPLPSGGINVYGRRSEPCQHMEVIYYLNSKAMYDGLGLEGAFERMGTTEEQILEALGTDREDAYIDACLQQYSYTALIAHFHSILGIGGSPAPFRPSPWNPNVAIASTEFLITYTIPSIWSRVLQPHLPPEVEMKYLDIEEDPHRRLVQLYAQAGKYVDPSVGRELHKLLKTMASFLERVDTRLSLTGAYCRSAEKPRFRICLCAHLLLDALVMVAGPMFTELPAIEIESSLGYYSSTLSIYRRVQGWCAWASSDIDSCSLAVQYIAALLPTVDKRDHTDCSGSFCAPSHLAQIRPHSHRDDCEGDCEYFSVQEDRVVNIIRDGGIPVVPGLPATGVLDLDVVDGRQLKSGYIAISHVCTYSSAQGMGNPDHNGIYSCHLRDLFEVVQDTGHGIWIDTLCVPVSGKYSVDRKSAILSMSDIYTNATVVFVIDSLLERIRDNDVEKRLYLLLSDWMHRVWTLQEVLLPGLDKVAIKRRHAAPMPLRDFIAPFAITSFCKLTLEISLRATVAQKFQLPRQGHVLYTSDNYSGVRSTWDIYHLAQAFQTRDTSRSADEAVCLGLLLGLKSRKALGSQGMEYIYSELKLIPSALAFTQMPRLRTPQFRALPRSFRRQRLPFGPTGGSIERHPTFYGMLVDSGFQIVRDGFIFEQIELGMEPWGKFSAILVDYDSKETAQCVSTDWIDRSKIKSKFIAVILDYCVNSLGGCVFVSITNSDQHHVYCRYLCHGFYRCGVDFENQTAQSKKTLDPCIVATFGEWATWVID